jgi:single-stranded-DNA-specific exonuclease
MATRWRLKPHDRDRIEELSRRSSLPPLLAQLLLNRGISDPNRAIAYLDAKLGALTDPEQIPGAADAANLIVQAIRDGRKIVIYGDYDVDGVCGTSILWQCLQIAGAKDVGYYIPHRVEEGYGVNADALRALATEEKASLVVTVDCGISAVKEADLARELGLQFIITDHHTIGPELPRAHAIVHPRLDSPDAPCADHCGAAVAFKLAWQICKQFGDGKRASPQLRDYLMRSLGLVALATVADMVPLSDENRIIVRHGLAGIASSPSVGLRALMEVAGCLGKKRLSTATIGFGLAPRINAAGRLERARRAVEMLTTQDPDLASEIARELDSYNLRRQEVERRIVEEARAMVEAQGGVESRKSIVLAHKDWHAGVIGIVAGRLVEHYHRPTIILAIGEEVVQGSARSIPGFDLYSALAACSDGLIAFGGHPAAAGLKLTEAHLPVFAELFEARCARRPDPPSRRPARPPRALRHWQPSSPAPGQQPPRRR